MRTVELAMQGSGAGLVMVDTLVADNSKHQEPSWYDLACISPPTYIHQAGPTSESGEHSVMAVNKSAQGACDQYTLQQGKQSDNSTTCCRIGQWQALCGHA